MFSNPHCEPCGRMHKRLRELQKKLEDKACIQYIFSSFGGDLDQSNKFLISAYQNNTIENSKKFMTYGLMAGSIIQLIFLININMILMYLL